MKKYMAKEMYCSTCTCGQHIKVVMVMDNGDEIVGTLSLELAESYMKDVGEMVTASRAGVPSATRH